MLLRRQNLCKKKEIDKQLDKWQNNDIPQKNTYRRNSLIPDTPCILNTFKFLPFSFPDVNFCFLSEQNRSEVLTIYSEGILVREV